jgi:hypothetical protein
MKRRGLVNLNCISVNFIVTLILTPTFGCIQFNRIRSLECNVVPVHGLAFVTKQQTARMYIQSSPPPYKWPHCTKYLLPVSLNAYSLHPATSTTKRRFTNPIFNAKNNDVIKQTGLEPNDLYQMAAQMKDSSDICYTRIE